MKPVKRRSSRSPSHRRPTKIGPSRDNRRPLEHSLTCLHNPSNASSITTHSAAYSGREAPPSITMEHASLDPFLRRPLSRVDPRSSHGISSRYRVNQSHSGPQAMGLTPTENVQPLYKYDTGKTETSAHSLQRDFARYVTGAGAGPSSNVWSGTTVVPHVRARQNNNSPVFDVMGSTADVDVLGHDTATLKPPVLFPGFEDDLNDFEFDAFVFSLGMEACSENKRTCMISALKILQTLHTPSPACLYACDETSIPSRRQPRMIDSVLSTNREIVLSVSNILKCSCSSSSQVQLVLTLICGKLIAWYRAVIRADDDVSDSPSSSSSMVRAVVNNNLNDKDLTERVLHQPITVGEYSLDMALEGKLRAQIVFSELQQLEGLIERLSRRIQEARLGNLDTAAPARSANASAPRASAAHVAVDLDYPTPPPPDETGLAEVTHPSLCSFLQKQLQVAKAETTQILSNERSAARGGFKGTFSLG